MFFSRVAQSPPATRPGHHERRIQFSALDGFSLIVSKAPEEMALWKTLVLEAVILAPLLLACVWREAGGKVNGCLGHCSGQRGKELRPLCL